jgi:2OG-Fe(II) oxygenase superfamily
MLNPQIYAEQIYYYTDVIDNPHQLVDLIESTNDSLTTSDAIQPWITWSSSDDPTDIFGYRKNIDHHRYESSSEQVKLAYSKINDALQAVAQDVQQRSGISIPSPRPAGISKYITGGYMGSHVDVREGTNPSFSAVMYLNDDYIGGDLFFGNQNIKIKPKAGSMIVFPSVPPFYHESLPIISGEKYISPFFWFHADAN